MADINLIDGFLSSKKFAIAGLSRNPKSFSRMVMSKLTNKGFEITPINPNVNEIDGKKCYKNVNELPDNIENLFIITNKSETDRILKSAVDKGIKSVWIQQGSDTKETLEIARKMNFDSLITKQCIFMYSEPTGLHKFHRMINKLFGLLAQ